MDSQEEFQAYLAELDDAYHNGEPLMTDSEYDKLIAIYEGKFGPYKKVGTLPRGDKVSLPFPLPSLDKTIVTREALEDKKLNSFLETARNVFIEHKIDGVSALYYKGHLYTRGNGIIGRDISHHNLKLPECEVPVRGEIVMTKKNFMRFKRHHPEAVNPRTSASGLIGRDEPSPELKYLSFIAYEIVNSSLLPSEQLIKLKELGFETVPIWNIEISVTSLRDLFLKEHQQADYAIDGLVLVSDDKRVLSIENPTSVFAFKVESLPIETKVLDVIWNPSKDRYLKPTVYYEPVIYDGSLLTSANGVNASFIVSNGIGPGAIITVMKRGEIIPNVMSVIKPTEPQYPDFDGSMYDWSPNEVDFILKVDIKEVIMKKVEHFVTIMGIEEFGLKRIQKCFEAGFDSLNKILRMTVDDFKTLDRFGDKLATTVHTNIQSRLNQNPMYRIMAASNIFGRGFGITRAKLLLESLEIDDLLDCSLADRIMKLKKVEGFGDVLATQVAVRLDDFVKWYNDSNLTAAKIEETLEEIEQSELTGKIVIVSGFRGSLEFQSSLKRRGAIYSDKPPTKRDAAKSILVTVGEGGSKETKAQQLGIPIMSKDTFMHKYNL